ncbi:MAG: hypothetical protein HZY75_12410 [Nocardioidaceae bacterium]|nr:MAG: hypothetical protein HZY75_12410 [Nocardioidaceae bacterium]
MTSIPTRWLLLAVSVVVIEAVAFAVFGVIELLHLDTSRPEVALTSGLFFLLWAVFLMFFSWRLSRLESWARPPLVMAQLIQVAVAFSWGGLSWAVVALLISAVLVLVGIFHPASIAAIESAESD